MNGPSLYRAVIPLQAVPAQTLTCQLMGQNTQINVYQKTTGLFVDVGLDNALIIAGVLAYDRNRIVRDVYRGFSGDIAFWDSQGTDDPYYTGIGIRWFLGYWSNP
jgi:hypothetical protein